jgi:hypothetical protein
MEGGRKYNFTNYCEIICDAKFCYYFQVRSVAAPELCVDTENKKADERFGLKECIKDNRRSKGEQVCLFVCLCVCVCLFVVYCYIILSSYC